MLPFDLNNAVHALGNLELTNAGVAIQFISKDEVHQWKVAFHHACEEAGEGIRS